MDTDSTMKPRMIIKEQKGVAAVEFALVLFMLVVLFFGICEIGLVLYNKQVITNASREGARAGIHRGIGSLDIPDVEAVVVKYCDQRLIDFNDTPFTDDNVDPNPDNTAARDSAPFGTDFSVKVSWNYGFFVPSLLNIGPTITITAETLMQMEQVSGS